jgi:YVTN family beta-propeller protein
MAGGPAVAARDNASGHRVVVLPLPANDSLAVLDAESGTLLQLHPARRAPRRGGRVADGSTAWVSVLGGPKPKSGERAATQCCDPRAEPVRVDARGIAERGTVVRVDLVNARVTASVTVGRHPTGLAWDESRGRLFVANGNSDDVSIVDTRTAAVVGTIVADPFRERRIGIAPTAVALADGGRRLYVTLGGANAVAVYDARPPDGPADALPRPHPDRLVSVEHRRQRRRTHRSPSARCSDGLGDGKSRRPARRTCTPCAAP